ncbi:MAG: hypothetical protein IJ368_09470 [Oscillospiraceae bacterium]|nr:hypothetical protein [Oscillospiraceae bacterium]
MSKIHVSYETCRGNCKSKFYPDGTVVSIFSNKPKFPLFEFPKEKKISADSIKCEIPDTSPLELLIFIDDPYFCIDEQSGEITLRYEQLQELREQEEKAKADKRRSDNVKRSKDKIYDLVACNDWDFFFTGTFGNTKFDPTDAKQAVKPLQKWLNNMVTRYGLKYILVAEYQPKSGRIHFHGFINDVLKTVDSGRRLYMKKAYDSAFFEKRGLNADDYPIIFNLPQWKFGFSTAIKTYNGSRGCASYITKYITKENKAIFRKVFLALSKFSKRTLYRRKSLRIQQYYCPGIFYSTY